MESERCRRVQHRCRGSIDKMKINMQDYNTVTVVEMHGEFVEEFTELFERKMTELTALNKEGIVLDFSNINFVDSKALEILLWLRDYCIANNCQLKIAGLDENCAKILEITQLTNKFDKYLELAEAVKSFA